MTALLILRDKPSNPCSPPLSHSSRSAEHNNPKPIDLHYDAIQAAMRGVFHELGLAA
jgi:hypothetical protein